MALSEFQTRFQIPRSKFKLCEKHSKVNGETIELSKSFSTFPPKLYFCGQLCNLMLSPNVTLLRSFKVDSPWVFIRIPYISKKSPTPLLLSQLPVAFIFTFRRKWVSINHVDSRGGSQKTNLHLKSDLVKVFTKGREGHKYSQKKSTWFMDTLKLPRGWL